MGITATILSTATGQPLQKMTFGRMPKPWASFTLESGDLAVADRIEVGKPAPGKFVAPVSVWVTVKKYPLTAQARPVDVEQAAAGRVEPERCADLA